jgi:hypothetical protein
MRFRKGQKLVCVLKGTWMHSPPLVKTYLWGFITRTFINATGPAYNEVVTCDGYNDFNHCFLAEYSGKCKITGKRLAWCESRFEPLVEDEVFEEAINEVFDSKSVGK